jgi:hypothetical protein
MCLFPEQDETHAIENSLTSIKSVGLKKEVVNCQISFRAGHEPAYPLPEILFDFSIVKLYIFLYKNDGFTPVLRKGI